jgi:hypothetical protein
MKETGEAQEESRLFGKRQVVVNIGAAVFEESLRRQGVEVVVVRWQPPREMSDDVAALLKDLL